ncbi:MAG: helix-turn-helix domain-containing protein [Polaromonas sp.]|nr:helix-turn-helix domain-containing protein [Polaromonas sp.]
MNERTGVTGAAANSVPDAVHWQDSPEALTPEPTAGALLRNAREAAGIHIAALAAALKVPEKKLEALEHDRLDLLLDAAFARALASSVCRILKIDAVPVLDRLPPNSIHRLKYPGTGVNAPFRRLPDITGQSAWMKISWPVVLSGLALLIGALVLTFMPASQQEDVHVSAVNFSVLPVAGTALGDGALGPTVTPTPEAGEPGIVQVADPVALPSSEAMSALAQVSDKTMVTVAQSKSASSPASAAVLATIPALPEPGAGQVTFRASDQSWVEVTDANGIVVLRRTLAAGDVAEASGVLPLAAVVGRADATQVHVRGKAFDLSAVSRDNVARFEVK